MDPYRENATPRSPRCLSTHGLAGWAPGTYFAFGDGVMVCGSCGKRVPYVPPTSRDIPETHPFKWPPSLGVVIAFVLAILMVCFLVAGR